MTQGNALFFRTTGMNPFQSQSLLGINIIVAPDKPRYTLPAEVLPGIPWPAGFKENIDSWASKFFKPVPTIPDNEVYFIGSKNMTMNPRTYNAVKVKLGNVSR